eukprot:365554-Chlamydomonas_euryale.AAC.15
MSGTFYASAAPGEPVFVKVGDRVKKGQTVGIIEAMKLMNEIEAEVSGEVVKLVAENGKPINAGQVRQPWGRGSSVGKASWWRA